MSFQIKNWTARQGTGLNKFTDTITGQKMQLVNSPDAITSYGDSFSVANMNDLESRILAGLSDTSPRGVYATTTALQTAYPTGTGGICVVTAEGKWYYWSGTAWAVGGTYQAASVAEDYNKLNGNLDTLKTDLSKVTKKEFENLNDGKYMLGFANSSGTIISSGYSFGSTNYLSVIGGKSIEFYSPNVSWIAVAEYTSVKSFTLRTLYISERRTNDNAAIKKLTLQSNTSYVRIFVSEAVDVNKINSAVIALYYSDNATNAFYDKYKSISTLSPLTGTTNKIRKEITTYLNCTNAYLQTSNGKPVTYASSLCTGYIDINAYDCVYFEGRADASGASLWVVYDANYNMLGNRDANISGKIRNFKISFTDILSSYPTAKYIRISSIYDANMKISSFTEPSVIEMYDAVSKQNTLWGKKYVACGDSFTAGDFAGGTDYDYNFQCFKTYAWYIASRNNMNFINEAISGTTMNSTKADAFSINRYKAIPSDTDYITLMFGLNETGATIGTLSDTTTTTVLGSWNVVLEYLITNYPYAKIGIILADSWLASAVYNAMKQVAEYWGIPYLDLRADKSLPMGINGRLGTTINPTAISLRNTAFQISTTDAHPNPKAHAYRSTIVEKWLRSL